MTRRPLAARALRSLCAGLLLVAALAAAGVAPAAGAETREPGPDLSTPQRIEEVFLQALGLIESGDPRRAVVLLRRILAKDPKLSRVRLELARAYFVMQSWPQSRAEFVTVLSSDVPRPVKQNVLRYINAIDSQRGFDWNAQAGLAMSPESGRNYKSDTVMLDFLGQEIPFKIDRPSSNAIGVSAKANGELRRRLFQPEGGPSVVGFLSGTADLFEAPGSEWDDDTLGLSAGPRLIWPQTTAVIAANTAVRFREGDVYEDRRGVSATVDYRTVAGLQPSVSAVWSRLDVHDSAAQDGDLYGLRAGLSKSVLGRADVGAFASVQRFDAKEDYESYDALNLGLVARADLGGGFGGSAQLGYWHTAYDEAPPFFPATRTDDRVSLDLEVVKTDAFLFGRFSPFVQVGYAHNASTLDIYAYDEFHFALGLRNAF